ncbi:MAG: hypothetical protein ACXWC8_09955 [Limisphaerales bacterium]
MNEKKEINMRTRKKQNVWSKPLLGCVVGLLCFSSPQLNAAGDAGVTTTMHKEGCLDDNVHMRLGVPLWAFGMEGDVGIGDRQGHVDKSFSSFFDDLDFEAPVKVELRKSRFFFQAGMIYVKSSRDLEPRGVFASDRSGDLTLKQLTADINLGYELVRDPFYSLTAYAGGA